LLLVTSMKPDALGVMSVRRSVPETGAKSPSASGSKPGSPGLRENAQSSHFPVNVKSKVGTAVATFAASTRMPATRTAVAQTGNE